MSSKNMQDSRDQGITSFLGKHAGFKEKPFSPNPDKNAVNLDFVDITALVRSVQRAEGNRDCFRRGRVQCDQTECAWRKYCLVSDKANVDKGP